MSQDISHLLKLTTHHDPDERIMATSDIITQVEKLETLPAKYQGLIFNAVLAQLEDTSTEVKTVAVKCLSMLVRKFDEDHVLGIVEKLGGFIVDVAKKESRDIYAIGLKTIIRSLDEQGGTAAANALAGCMVQGLKRPSSQSDDELRTQCLDVLKDLLLAFGPTITSLHGDIMQVLCTDLKNSNESIRKRAVSSLGTLISAGGDDLLQQATTILLKQLDDPSLPPALCYSAIQAIGVICQAAGTRVGKYLETIIPKLLAFCKLNDSTEEEREQSVELLENCLQAFEAILLLCPSEVAPYTDKLVDTALTFASYDPNYCYDDNEDEEGKQGDSSAMADDDEEDGGEGGWSDEDDDEWIREANAADDAEDDGSWRLRRAAAKCVSAAVAGALPSVVGRGVALLDAVISRLKERDSTVQMCFFTALSNILQLAVLSNPAPGVTRQPSAVAPALLLRVGAVLTKCAAEVAPARLAGKSTHSATQIQEAVLSVYLQLLRVFGGQQLGVGHVTALLPTALEGLKLEALTPKLAALSLCQELLGEMGHTTPPVSASAAGASFAADLATSICELMSHPYAKLKVCALQLVPAVAGAQGSQHADAVSLRLYGAVMSVLRVVDIDQDVKEKALVAIAALLHTFSTQLSEKVEEVVPVVVARLSNELTRIWALRALIRIFSSRLSPAAAAAAVNAVVTEAATPLVEFLKKDSAPLRHATLQAVVAAVNAGPTPPPHALREFGLSLCTQAAALITHTDLVQSRLVLGLVGTLLGKFCTDNPAQLPCLPTVLRACLRLLHSPVLSGDTRTVPAVVDVFAVLAKTAAASSGSVQAEYTPQGLQEALVKSVTPAASLPSLTGVAKCVSSVVVTQADALAMVGKFLHMVSDEAAPSHQRETGLLVLGELGLAWPAVVTDKAEQLEASIFAAFGSSSSGLQAAASLAYGNMAVGNLAKYMPELCKALGTSPPSSSSSSSSSSAGKQTFLLLTSLKQAVNAHVSTQEGLPLPSSFAPFVPTVAPLLFALAPADDDGVRMLVAECLGAVAAVEAAVEAEVSSSSSTVFTRLTEMSADPNPRTRAVMISALRVASLTQLTPAAALVKSLPVVLRLLKDSNLSVQKATLSTVNTLLHRRVDLLGAKSILQQLTPILFTHSKPNPALVRQVEFGAFSHSIDDGLPLRKGAYQALETLLETASHSLNLTQFCGIVKEGLTDHDDIQTVAYGILEKVAKAHSRAMLTVADQLPEKVMIGVRAKLKEAKLPGAEGERAKEVLRVAVRCLYAINSLSGIAACSTFTGFYLRVLKTSLLAQMLDDFLKSKQL
eukprot:CAMPEP_0175136666 /NCGR_PEP_ID=MMETSP0087-20121206/9404_1 /TAXON_ID=136419 /ORGANISM="Unknown Unknown, Strain D1" /LENGTH=1304 /DNA_ID=CAMNT_0016419451 /DNA_START=35 /DNA_END=3949 /DNA_ORIENTATION=-